MMTVKRGNYRLAWEIKREKWTLKQFVNWRTARTQKKIVKNQDIHFFVSHVCQLTLTRTYLLFVCRMPKRRRKREERGKKSYRQCVGPHVKINSCLQFSYEINCSLRSLAHSNSNECERRAIRIKRRKKYWKTKFFWVWVKYASLLRWQNILKLSHGFFSPLRPSFGNSSSSHLISITRRGNGEQGEANW